MSGKENPKAKSIVSRSKNVINFSNVLMKSPLRYTLMERRFLYKLASLIKTRYNLMGLEIRKNWENLYFELTNKDLAEIGGKSGNKHVTRTYNMVCSLADRTIYQYYLNKKGELQIGRFHWINSFIWNVDKNNYTVEVSPQLYDYVCCMTSRFTHFDLHTGIMLSTKYSQKFFEICSMYTSDEAHPFQFQAKNNTNGALKANVLRISIDSFRFLFGLSEVRDDRTGKVVEKAKLQRFGKIEEKVILPSRKELYEFYTRGESRVWFDYSVERSGRGRSRAITNIYIYFYTRQHPKSSDPLTDCPRKNGEDLCPFEAKTFVARNNGRKDKNSVLYNKKKKMFSGVQLDQYVKESLFDFDVNNQRLFLEQYLRRYLSKEELKYYMSKMDEEQAINTDSYSQVIQELLIKYKQEKFIQSTESYKKNCIINYVFKENLKKYGWNIPPKEEN